MTDSIPFTDPRKLLRRHDLRPKKGFSQNFLVSPHAHATIVRTVRTSYETACKDASDKRVGVVELGPGLGTLTEGLLDFGSPLVVVERDADMIAVLKSEFPMLSIVDGDAAAIDFSALHTQLGTPQPIDRWVVAGNLPYAITGRILRNLIDQHTFISHAIIMIQKEVQVRLCADPGSKAYGALTVFVQNHFEPENVMLVPAGSFHPPPKVDSAVVQLTRRTSPLVEEGDAFNLLVRTAFQRRRKQLGNTLKALGIDGDDRVSSFRNADIDPARRPETLSVQEFGSLTIAIRPYL